MPMSEDQARPEPHDKAPEGATRCGFIAIIGAPNAGKSTLVNTLVGTKVAIVSRKVQTTRTTLRGIAIEWQSQLVFIDTPGIFAPKRRLDRAMVDAAWGGAGDADLVLLVVDAAKGVDEDVERILGKLAPNSCHARSRDAVGLPIGARNAPQRPLPLVAGPLWGKDRMGGNPKHPRSGLPPPLAPPHKGERNPVEVAGKPVTGYRDLRRSSRAGSSSPSTRWTGFARSGCWSWRPRSTPACRSPGPS